MLVQHKPANCRISRSLPTLCFMHTGPELSDPLRFQFWTLIPELFEDVFHPLININLMESYSCFLALSAFA